MAAPKEFWKPIPETKDYFASSIGRIKRNDKILSLCYNNGYLVVNINSKTKRVHRLVACAFIENTLSKKTINHKNGIRSDNRIENLEWATHSDNLKHKYAVLNNKPQKNYGAKNGLSRLIVNTQNGVFYESIKEASCAFNIKRTTLNAMLSGQNKNITNLKYA